MVADCTKFKTKTLRGKTNPKKINKMNKTCRVKKKSTKLYAKTLKKKKKKSPTKPTFLLLSTLRYLKDIYPKFLFCFGLVRFITICSFI